MKDLDEDRLEELSRGELIEAVRQLLSLARELLERDKRTSRTSSQPPSSDDPYRREEERKKKDGSGDGGGSSPSSGSGGAGRPGGRPGKRRGARGHWRRQPIVVDRQIDHDAATCGECGAVLGSERRSRQVSGHYVYELERGAMSLAVVAEKHCYYAARCGCGHETAARPGTGRSSQIEGRRRNLHLSERCLVGPMLAAFIAALALRIRLSRKKIQEFLGEWLGLELGTATIERCIHEFGLASEPVVEDLVKQVRSAALVHADETPWYQGGALVWLWVLTNASTVIFRIGSRSKEELTALLGEAYLGWLVSDGYAAYRDHPRRQRCLAHLIRKAVALSEGCYRPTVLHFGRTLAENLRSLIRKVAEGGRDGDVTALLGRIQRSCEWHRYSEEKVRALACEILNDWSAVIAFVDDPKLPATNNDAERALRHAVIARRISYGTRTEEGSRCYAAALSVVETCRKRAADVWAYARDLIATARKGLPHPPMPLAQPP